VIELKVPVEVATKRARRRYGAPLAEIDIPADEVLPIVSAKTETGMVIRAINTSAERPKIVAIRERWVILDMDSSLRWRDKILCDMN
jgi:hypothetical protein